MPGRPEFDRLLEELASVTPAHVGDTLASLKSSYGLDRILYVDAEQQPGGAWQGRLLHDAHPPLTRLFHDKGVDVLAPLLASLADVFGPCELDLRPLIAAEPKLRDALAICQLGPSALVFPLVRSRPGVAFLACFCGEQGWQRPVSTLMRDLCLFAGLLHAKLRRHRDVTAEHVSGRAREIRLTPREREVLQWVAAGKSYWEIARILDISERTIRHFMANCRAKLDSVSNKQAVAKAVAGAMIEAPETTARNV
jgi:LuxR family transcriptional regulator, quorum-sensing system regulator SinR